MYGRACFRRRLTDSLLLWLPASGRRRIRHSSMRPANWRWMKRAEVWTVSGGADYAGKPPAVIVQDDDFDGTGSITICVFTSNPTEAPLFRILVEPSAGNGLRVASRLMVDKVTTVPRSKLGSRLGRLADEDVVRLNRALMVFLGLARSPRSGGVSDG